MRFSRGRTACAFPTSFPIRATSASLRETSTYDAQRVLLVVPPTMQISSPGFTPAGTEQGFNVFSKESIKAGTGFDVAVSGTAPPPADSFRFRGSRSGEWPRLGDGPDSGPTIETSPARLDDEKWILLGGLAAIFAVGVGLLLAQASSGVVRRRRPAPPSSCQGRARRSARRSKVRKPRRSAAAACVEKVTHEVNTNLDSLKDTLLRIELRRQAGTISDEEYARGARSRGAIAARSGPGLSRRACPQRLHLPPTSAAPIAD